MTARFIFNTEPELGMGMAYTKTNDEFITGYSVRTSAGGPVIWLKAAAAILEGQACYITTNVTTGVQTAALVTTAIATTVVQSIVIAHKAVASGEYGWFFEGPFDNVQILTTTGIGIGTPLTTHTVAGTVSTGGTVIAGLSAIAITTAGLSLCRATTCLKCNG